MKTALFMLLPVLVTLLLLWLSLRLLLSSQWILGWLRGMAGMLMVVLTLGAGLMTYDMRTFAGTESSRPLAVISFSQSSVDKWVADIVSHTGQSYSAPISGDLWRISAEHIAWDIETFSGELARLENLDGRYLSLEQQRSYQSQLTDSNEYPFSVDSWPVVKKLGQLKKIESGVVSSDYLPMQDGAIYEVWLKQGVIEVSAVNEVARQALSSIE
ncbi:hypothetical protein [Parendozoicomonas sp. Alg238-R29]|uniref:hypothetical protein n=1 Tax=Parendozoicomonas sp. Alg238-R29 TaxID=2993446 RepID=UPI00248D8383|nr:hypothetical protein [Parendozoicomonas sp. Alg238-R29]